MVTRRKRESPQLAFGFARPPTPYERWHEAGYAGTWLDYLDFICWVPGETPEFGIAY